MYCLMKSHTGPLWMGTRRGHILSTGCLLMACACWDVGAHLAWVTSCHQGSRQEARGRGWQRCRKECLEMSKNLLLCALLAEPLRTEPSSEEILNMAEMLMVREGFGQCGKCSFTGLFYLRQNTALRHLCMSGQNEKFHFQVSQHRY